MCLHMGRGGGGGGSDDNFCVFVIANIVLKFGVFN